MTAIVSCALRRMTEADLEQVRVWRNSDRIRAVMYSDEVIAADDQRRWFADMKNDPLRAYLVFEVNGKPAGVAYFNPIDRETKTATWGFYLGDPDAPRGAGGRLGEAALAYAFETLELRTVFAETFAFNERAVRYHELLGFTRLEAGGVHLKNGKPCDVVKFRLDRDAWAARRGSV